MNSDWQSLTSAGLVILTAAGFLLRLLRAKQGPKCGGCGGCGPRRADKAAKK
jgi:hypothetical protein